MSIYQTSPKFVAICDVLGFKELIKTQRQLDNVIEQYYSLLGACSKATKTNKNKNVLMERPSVSIPYSFFSDTLLLWSVKIEPFFQCLERLIYMSIRLEMPLRVGVAYGECFMKKNEGIFIGQPIIDAYMTEQSQEWIGGACHKTCYNNDLFEERVRNSSLLLPYDIPLKSNANTIPINYGFNWVQYIDYKHISWLIKSERNEQRPDVWRKYNNTLSFYNDYSGKVEKFKRTS